MVIEAEVQKINHIPKTHSINEVAGSPSQDESDRECPIRVSPGELSLKVDYQNDAEDRDENEESCLVTQYSEGRSGIVDVGEMKYILKDWN